MIRLTHPLPKKYWIAVSGGIDSMAALHWLNIGKPKRRSSLLGILHIHHNTGDHASLTCTYVNRYARKHSIPTQTKLLNKNIPKGKSKEAWWREQRYSFFHSFKEPVILAHNFDDCLEEYIMCSMVRGYLGTIPYSNGNCVRPFRLWKRKDIKEYMLNSGVFWCEDNSNIDMKFKRNYIRHKIVPYIREINPGIYKLVERAIKEQDKR